MCAWALGRIGDRSAQAGLEAFLPGTPEPVSEEIRHAMAGCRESEQKVS